MRQASVANAEVSQTSAALFTSGFAGEYPLIMPEWGHPKGKLEVLLGGPFMIQVAEELAHRPRREYILMDRFQDHPLHHDLVILDCPATLGSMNTVALAAATHLLIPLSLSAKSFSGADALLTWYVNACQYLRLMPPLKATTPEVLGIVPSMYNNTEAGERAFLDQLPQMVAPLGLRVYPHVRYSAEFKNAATQGLPLQIYRPGHKGGKDFDLVCRDLAQLMREARNG